MIEARDVPADVTQEVTSLVPRQSVVRTAVLALVAVALLTAAWFSPAVVRPTLQGGNSSAGTSITLDDGDSVLTVTQLNPRAWPSARLDAVGDVPGARAVDVWLIASDTSPQVAGNGNVQDALTILRAAYPDADITPGGNLPHAFRSGEGMHVAILWQVEDCAALDPDILPEAQLRGFLGSEHLDPLWDAAGPAVYLDPALVPDQACKVEP